MGLEPRADLIAANLDSSEEEVTEMIQRLGADELSLSPAEGEDQYAAFANRLPDRRQSVEDALAAGQIARYFSSQLKAFRNRLSGKEAEIFDKRILSEEPVTLRELGTSYNISRERVRQIQAALVAKFAKTLKRDDRFSVESLSLQ